MCGIVHVTDHVEIEAVSDGIQFVLRSGTDSFSFHMGRQEARAAAAETWRLLDEVERENATVHAIGKRRRR